MHFAPNLPSEGERGGGHFAYEKSGDARRKFWIKPPKGDRSGRGPTFFWPLKETMLKHRQYIYFYIFSRATLTETFTAKYDGVCPEHPKWDQNPKFTPLSETTSIPTPFICGVPPPPEPSNKWIISKQITYEPLVTVTSNIVLQTLVTVFLSGVFVKEIHESKNDFGPSLLKIRTVKHETKESKMRNRLS